MGQYHWCEKIFIIVNVYYITSICKQCIWKEKKIKKIIWEKIIILLLFKRKIFPSNTSIPVTVGRYKHVLTCIFLIDWISIQINLSKVSPFVNFSVWVSSVKAKGVQQFTSWKLSLGNENLFMFFNLFCNLPLLWWRCIKFLSWWCHFVVCLISKTKG